MAAATEPPETPETCDADVMQSAQEAGRNYRSAEAAAVQGDAEAAAGGGAGAPPLAVRTFLRSARYAFVGLAQVGCLPSL